MSIEEIKAALQEALDQLDDETLELSDDELKALEDKVATLTDALAEAEAAAENRANIRAAAQQRARAAIESGAARTAAVAAPTGSVAETTDMAAAERRGWLKHVATRAGLELSGGNAMSDAERRAFTHLTTNSSSVVPEEIRGEIVDLVDQSTVLYSDVPKDGFKHQYQVVRHTGITAGDAGKSSEGASWSVDEQNAFDVVTLTGQTIRKTAKLSRQMSVQSIDGFESWLVRELSGRMANAADLITYNAITGDAAGMAAKNKVKTTAKGKLALGDVTKALSLLKRYSEPAPKGIVVYASQDTIWNHLAMLLDATGRPYFVESVADEDPSVQGRIFGKAVKQYDNMADGLVLLGYPDLARGNVFDGPDVDAYTDHDTQDHCFTGYELYDLALSVPSGFALLDIAQAAAGGTE